MSESSDQVRRERDFYLRLLELGGQEELPVLLEDALRLVVEITGARAGYLEITGSDPGDEDDRWSMALGLDGEELENVRHLVSRGIVAETMANAKTLIVPSAALDPRFASRESVRHGRIHAVLCTPVGENPPIGVVYLEGEGGPDAFSDADVRQVERFARHLGPLAHRLLLREREQEDPTVPFRRKLRLDAFVGRSGAVARLFQDVAAVSPLEISLLLTGATGTGKSLVARLIHDNGPRARGPFVEVNCGALPESLVESELFGAEPGAHSTANRRVEGKVAAADRGTLFLDEVAELPLGAQASLLQLLQSGQFFPLGASRPRTGDVRVIAATNADLEIETREKRFREDLFYRLHVMPIRLPSLAERREDVPMLFRRFLEEACSRNRLPRLEVSTAALHAAEVAEWPGNIRQLANAVEAAAVRAAGLASPRIERSHLLPEASGGASPNRRATFQEATREFQAGFLQKALDDGDWNVTQVARELEVARSHLYHLVRAFGLRPGKRV